MALDLFDRLRLREPFGQAFGALGFEGEEGWRVAARIKVVLLSEAGIGKPQPAAVQVPAEELTGMPAGRAAEQPAPADISKGSLPLGSVTGHDFSRAAEAQPSFGASAPAGSSSQAAPALDALPSCVESVALEPALWLDPDVRWLTGVHEAEGHAYLVRERYEELLWWLLMPSLLCLAGEPKLDRKAISQIGKLVDEALESAEAAGYRIDRLLGNRAEEDAGNLGPALPETDALKAEHSQKAEVLDSENTSSKGSVQSEENDA
jgi:hypothetical protein